MSTKTLNIALDEKLLKEIDETVRKDMGSRSEYFRRLALNDLERRREWKQVLDTANKKVAIWVSPVRIKSIKS